MFERQSQFGCGPNWACFCSLSLFHSLACSFHFPRRFHWLSPNCYFLQRVKLSPHDSISRDNRFFQCKTITTNHFSLAWERCLSHSQFRIFGFTRFPGFASSNFTGAQRQTELSEHSLSEGAIFLSEEKSAKKLWGKSPKIIERKEEEKNKSRDRGSSPVVLETATRAWRGSVAYRWLQSFSHVWIFAPWSLLEDRRNKHDFCSNHK